MYYNLKKEIIKNVVYISFILLLAIISTYVIYHKFEETRNTDVSSESLDIIYHETTGDKLSIRKVTPVTDSVGLSSKSYSITIKNNLTEDVDYSVKVVDDIKTIAEDECQEFQIPKEDIRISIKVNRNDNEIYDLNELEDNILYNGQINALDTDNIAIRVWVKQDSTLPRGSYMHYHGLLKIIEDINR